MPLPVSYIPVRLTGTSRSQTGRSDQFSRPSLTTSIMVPQHGQVESTPVWPQGSEVTDSISVSHQERDRGRSGPSGWVQTGPDGSGTTWTVCVPVRGSWRTQKRLQSPCRPGFKPSTFCLQGSNNHHKLIFIFCDIYDSSIHPFIPNWVTRG